MQALFSIIAIAGYKFRQEAAASSRCSSSPPTESLVFASSCCLFLSCACNDSLCVSSLGREEGGYLWLLVLALRMLSCMVDRRVDTSQQKGDENCLSRGIRKKGLQKRSMITMAGKSGKKENIASKHIILINLYKKKFPDMGYRKKLRLLVTSQQLRTSKPCLFVFAAKSGKEITLLDKAEYTPLKFMIFALGPLRPSHPRISPRPFFKL